MTNTIYRYITLDFVFVFKALFTKQFASNFSPTHLYNEEMRLCSKLSYAIVYKGVFFFPTLYIALGDPIL